jgi:Immunity protein 26
VKLPYREGTWFAVPLRKGGFAIGVVARATRSGKVILCYFFGPRQDSVPPLLEAERLAPGDAIRVVRVGDLSLIRGEWPIIGNSRIWDRASWPMPPFVRRSELSRRAWRVYYSDQDPNLVLGEEPEPYETTVLEPDAVYGAGAAEIVLTSQLTNP